MKSSLYPGLCAIFVAVALFAGVGHRDVAAAPRTTTLETADYTFDCPTYDYQYHCEQATSAPNPAVWTANRYGAQSSWCTAPAEVGVAECAFPGAGLAMSDAGHGAQLLYEYQPQSFSVDPASPNSYNTAVFRVTSQVPYITDGSPAWSAEHIAWRMIFDDGARRVELKLGRSPSHQRQVSIGNTSLSPIPFPWDNGLANTYEIARRSTGDFVVTIISGDPGQPPVSAFVPAGTVWSASGTPLIAWGTAWEGGGSAYFEGAHFEVARPTGTATGKGTIDSPAGTVPGNPTASGPAKFTLSAKYAKGLPAGSLTLDQPSAQLSFRSTTVSELAFTGAGVQMRGTGSVNGVGGYRFVLQANAGSAGGGAFHLRIWDPNVLTWTAIFDNEPTLDAWSGGATAPLLSGSIAIR